MLAQRLKSGLTARSQALSHSHSPLKRLVRCTSLEEKPRAILQVPGLASLVSSKQAPTNGQRSYSSDTNGQRSSSSDTSPPPRGMQGVVQTEDSWEEVGTEDLAPHPTKHPVLQLILKRTREGSKPNRRTDNAKLGLVVEGGGMRGVISGAMLMALHALGFKSAFDAVYGASAGAINATYFLSGEAHGLKIYGEDLTGTRFIDVRTLLSPAGGLGFMKLDYLVDYVMRKVKPLNWQAVIDSPVPLKVVASSLDELRPLMLEQFADDNDLAECIKASAAVPKLSGPPIEHRGHRLVDAAVFEPVPVRAALADGCTHVLVLATRPAVQHTTLQRYVRGTVVWAVKKTVLNAPYMSEAWASDLAEEGLVMQQEAELVSTLQRHPEAVRKEMGAYLMPVYPHSTQGCTPLTTASEVLSAAEAEGWRAIMMLFGRPDLLPKEEPGQRELRRDKPRHQRQKEEASEPAGVLFGFGARAEQLVRRWLRMGLESREAVDRQAESAQSRSSAYTTATQTGSTQGSSTAYTPLEHHAAQGKHEGQPEDSTLQRLQGDGGDSVLAAAAEMAARGSAASPSASSEGQSTSSIQGKDKDGLPGDVRDEDGAADAGGRGAGVGVDGEQQRGQPQDSGSEGAQRSEQE